jgi:N-acetylglutamate synthase-like GNAT family acetyltransferase
MMIRLIPATQETVRAAYGLETPPRSVRAIAAEKDGEVIGCAGVYLHDGVRIMFSDLGPELRARPKWIIRGWRRLMEMVQASDIPVLAAADEDIPGAPAFLEHLGFQHVEGRLYRWQR